MDIYYQGVLASLCISTALSIFVYAIDDKPKVNIWPFVMALIFCSFFSWLFVLVVTLFVLYLSFTYVRLRISISRLDGMIKGKSEEQVAEIIKSEKYKARLEKIYDRL